ncbi:MAG TPA: DUF4197 domain-containing protein [Candidatus Sulfotelmatobacter sp.]|jgi:hypothetical protein
MTALRRPYRLIIALALCGSACAAAQLHENRQEADKGHDVGDDSGLSDDQIVAGLKQALEFGASKAVAVAGKPDGFLNNEAIRILLPTKLQSVGKAMRLLSQGETVDDLEIGMNRAAERASPQAKQIFLDAIKKMNVAHNGARHILAGGDTAATEYFQQTCSADLTAAFSPIVHGALQRAGVIKKYDQVIKTAPGGNAIANEFDLDKYVVGKTLDGLFYLLGQEEIQIRTTPAAQTTPLLKEVFSRK